MEFIEVNKITPANGILAIKKETIKVADISSFRYWNKKKGDAEDNIEGDILVINMKALDKDNKPVIQAIKIAESEESFTSRLGGKVIRLKIG